MQATASWGRPIRGKTVTEFDFRPRPTPERPLLGLTVLVVEDSRFASDALRLMCLRSGARIRRADCVASAERHLNVYRPSAAIIDIGLPDGSGLELIARMAEMSPQVPIILGTSGAERHLTEQAALEAGAQGFLAKPIESLATFQAAVSAHLPPDRLPRGPRSIDLTDVAPDLVALREDLAHAMDLLALNAPPIGYLRRFLIRLARSAEDTSLEHRARAMGTAFSGQDKMDMRALLSNRIQALPMAF